MIVRLLRLYEELASWFHLLTAPEAYAEETELYRRLLQEGAGGVPREDDSVSHRGRAASPGGPADPEPSA